MSRPRPSPAPATEATEPAMPPVLEAWTETRPPASTSLRRSSATVSARFTSTDTAPEAAISPEPDPAKAKFALYWWLEAWISTFWAVPVSPW